MNISLRNQRRRGLTLVEVCIVMAVLVILAFILFPAHPPKARALRIQCVNNLKQNGLALRVWAADHGDKYPMEISETNGGAMEFPTGPNLFRFFQVISNELSTPKVVICPADDSRPTAATNFTFLRNSNISYFVNFDPKKTDPENIFSGDRNITNGTPIKNGILELTKNSSAGWTAELHNKVGNLTLSDGSVQQVSQTGLRSTVQNTGLATNRLLMPIFGP